MTDFKFSKSFEEAVEAKVTAEQNALREKNNLDKVRFEAQQKVVMVVEAQDRQKLAELTVGALASVEMAIGGMHLMPAEEHRTSMFDKE